MVITAIAGSAENAASKRVVSEAYHRLGVEIEFSDHDAAAALRLVDTGKADAALQRIGGLDRDFPRLHQIPVPINVIQGGAFSKEHRFPVKGWNSLRPYRIGIVRGVVFAAEGSAGMDVRVAADGVELMRWVEDGEVDVAVLPRV